MRRHVSELIARLDRRAYAVSLYAPPDFVLEFDAPDAVRCAVHIGAATHIRADFAEIRRLAPLLRGAHDLVHAHGLRAALIGGMAARLAAVPYIVTIHNLIPRMSAARRAALGFVLRKAAKTIAVSMAAAEDCRFLGLPGDRIAVAPNGVDAGAYITTEEQALIRRELGIDPEAQIVAGIGRLAPEKGFDVLIDAVAALAPLNRAIVLILAGEGPEEPALRKRAASLGSRALFLGRRSDIPSLLCAADLVAVPSRSEGQGIVPLEAMAAGRAVIASRVGGLEETILNGSTGMLVPPQDAGALADAIETLLADPRRRKAQGEAGRKRVTEHYSLREQIEKIEAIYRDVVRYPA